MMSKLALRTLGAVAVPGALLAVSAPAASAVEISTPSTVTEQANGNAVLDMVQDAAPEMPETNGLGGGQSIGL